MARGAAADPAPTRRSLIERRLSASQHRGKVRHAVLARSQHRRDRRKTMMVRLRNERFRAAVAVGSPWGEEDQEDLLHHHRAAAAQWATPCSARTNFLASDEKALANFRKFLAKAQLFSEVRYCPGGRQKKEKRRDERSSKATSLRGSDCDPCVLRNGARRRAHHSSRAHTTDVVTHHERRPKTSIFAKIFRRAIRENFPARSARRPNHRPRTTDHGYGRGHGASHGPCRHRPWPWQQTAAVDHGHGPRTTVQKAGQVAWFSSSFLAFFMWLGCCLAVG